ncbi:hypothetical protein Pmani_000411 [Petrolisthes manimaculis]|uniref:Neuroblastoma-amplified sequence n=1 Tax=Petrolisthes manimaculis TaxID=1843537 RepID=A0AAE1UQB6_9EUCA|nr:hypothetical protein Pmani_000411 [Petrolisthes manimaculis]
MGQNINGDENKVLYELLVHAEWPLKPHAIGGGVKSLGGNFFYRTVTQTPANVCALASTLWGYVTSASPVPPSLAKVVGGRCEWKLGVGGQGAVVALVQGAALEVRAKKDDFASVVGRNSTLYPDPLPWWRLVSWSGDCSMVGVAHSSGAVEIFNTLANSLFTIYPPRYKAGSPQVDAGNALAALVFTDVRTQNMKWASELVLVDYKGEVRSYYVSPTEGYQETHTFSFTSVYPAGITAAACHKSLLLVGGCCEYNSDTSLKNNGLGHGITIWRFLDDFPHYKQVATIDEEEYLPPSVGIMKRLVGWVWSAPQYDSIFHLSPSPSGQLLAALHTSGSLSIWELPSLRKRKFWQLMNQPDIDATSPSLATYSERSSKASRSPERALVESLRQYPVDLRWWSECAVILARYSGAVTVSSVASLHNLLGGLPEFMEGVPQISDASDRAFLCLEAESRGSVKRVHSSLKRRSQGLLDTGEEGQERREEEGHDDDDDDDDVVVGDDNDGYLDSDDDDDDDEEISVFQRSHRLANRALYWATDAERFRPPSKRPRLMQRTYRLLCLKSTTPEELFERKIENEEYGEALALARSYNLDCDRVYQQQWRCNEVTVASIQDYLAKVKKRTWVLSQCLTRVPENIYAARELLLYGLRGTDLEAVVGGGGDGDNGAWVPSDLELLEFEPESLDAVVDPSEAEVRLQERQAAVLNRKHKLLSKINFKSLTTEQKTIIRARQKLLTYLDRLSTYEILLGGPHVARDLYDAAFFDKFRSQTAVSATVEFARGYDWRAVDIMFTYHGKETLPHRLPILSCFPPIMAPFEYQSLLPECKGDEVYPWEQERPRHLDWCEEPVCRAAAVVGDGDGDNSDRAAFLYRECPHLQEFRGTGAGGELSGEVVSHWYQERAKDVERQSHFVDAALDLLKLGRGRGVQSLEELHDWLDCLEVMVYEADHIRLSLDEFLALSHLEKITSLMSSSTSETYIQNVRRWLLPCLNRIDKWEPGSAKTLLHTYMVNTAKDDLGLPLKILQHSRPDQHAPIIPSAGEMMMVAVECVYACQREDQLPQAFAVLECLPERGSGHVGDSEELCELHDLADILEAHLTAAEVLSNHSVNVTPRHLRDLHQDQDRVRELLTKLTRAAARREPRMSDEDWRKLLYSMLELQQKVFTCLEPQVCFEKVTEALLCSGHRDNISLAGELLETRPDRSPVNNPYLQQLPYTQAVQMVVSAATHYFNSSENHTDQAMDLARQCLRLIECDNEDIKREKDLITALQILPDFGILLLPLQVRLCEDRLGLISQCLESKQGGYYRHWSRLLHLASLLRACGNSDAQTRQALVLSLVAQAALRAGDYMVCGSVCEQLVCGEHSEGWEVCGALGSTHRFANLPARARFLDFALTHAPASHLEDLINTRNEVEMATLYSKVNTQMDLNNSSIDSDDGGFVDAQSFQQVDDDGDDDGDDNVDDDGVLGGVTRSVLSVTAATTATLLNTVASKKFWKSAVNWMQPLSKLSGEGERSQLSPDTNADFLKQGCHAFYADIIPDHHISSLGVSYQSYASTTTVPTSPALDFSLALLRIGLTQETLTQGASVKTTPTVVSEAARGVLREDVGLGLMLLSILNEPKHTKAVLDSLPCTHLSLQITQYFYALQIYTSLYPWCEVSLSPVYLRDPTAVIARVNKMVESETELKEASESVRQYVELFLSTRELVADYVQGQALLRLGAGVDIDRFLSDAGYKEDTVLGLAMTLEAEVLDLALTLAGKYDVPLWDVYMTHLQHLFDSEVATTDEIRGHVTTKTKLMDTLKAKPNDFVKRMEENVYLTVAGWDHERLLLYYWLLEECGGRTHTARQAAAHTKLLKKLKGSAQGLNYKQLLKPDTDVLTVLQPVLTANNVNSLAKAVKSLPGRKGEGIDSSTVYCAWAEKYFFDIPPEKKMKTSNDWIHRYDLCRDYMQRMSGCDVERFVRGLVLSRVACTLPLEARAEITRRAVKFCHQQQAKHKTTTTTADDDDVVKRWSEAALVMERWEGHLHLLRSTTYTRLQHNSDHHLRDYATRFAETGSDEALLTQLACSVVVEGGKLNTLGEVLSVYPDHVATTPEDVLMDTLRLLVSHWQGNKVDMLTTDSQEAAVGVLDHVLGEVRSYLDDGGEVLGEEEVLSVLRELCEDSAVEVNTKLQVLAVAQKHLSVSEEDLELERVMRTGGIVGEAWPDTHNIHVDATQVCSVEGRRSLLSLLTQHTTNMTQAKALIRLLTLWPPFTQQEYTSPSSNPWLAVFERVLSLSSEEEEEEEGERLQLVWQASKHADSQEQLPENCVEAVVKQLQHKGGHRGFKWTSKVALLLSTNTKLHNKVLMENLHGIQKIVGSDYDGELLEGTVRRELVPALLPTPLYSPLVTHLMESGDVDVLEEAVRQLEEAGRHKEAASLAVSQSSLPKALHNMTAALKTYKKWL